jgi:hypothetical protein
MYLRSRPHLFLRIVSPSPDLDGAFCARCADQHAVGPVAIATDWPSVALAVALASQAPIIREVGCASARERVRLVGGAIGVHMLDRRILEAGLRELGEQGTELPIGTFCRVTEKGHIVASYVDNVPKRSSVSLGRLEVC